MTVGAGLEARLARAARGGGLLVALTGAGVSAASGIPTFRGGDGFWTVGSEHYTPQEMATWAQFERFPEAVWGWYLYRRGLCLTARPNAAHTALADLERALGDRFVLLTQNVDGLHLRAGNSAARTLQVHGNLHWMRCARECGGAPVPVPEALAPRPKGEPLHAAERAHLTCPRCGAWMRPHVLWFDESYDESRYRFHSALRAADGAAVLLIIGTSGAAMMPVAAGERAARAGAWVVNVDPGDTPFAPWTHLAGGMHIAAAADAALPAIATACIAAFGRAR